MTTNTLVASTRYFCTNAGDDWVCDNFANAIVGAPGDDDECRCDVCDEIMSSFGVWECPRCLEWIESAAPQEEIEEFAREHDCVPVVVFNG